ncbi:MAG: hypothetical protein WA231_06340, partial [Methylocella sp.]
MIVDGLELLSELTAAVLFVRGEFVKPSRHLGTGIYPKATINYLGNTPSRRQERIQMCVERSLPT